MKELENQQPKGIEDLEPWQTTTGLKIFILLRFLAKIVFHLSLLIFLIFILFDLKTIPIKYVFLYFLFLCLVYDKKETLSFLKEIFTGKLFKGSPLLKIFKRN